MYRKALEAALRQPMETQGAGYDLDCFGKFKHGEETFVCATDGFVMFACLEAMSGLSEVKFGEEMPNFHSVFSLLTSDRTKKILSLPVGHVKKWAGSHETYKICKNCNGIKPQKCSNCDGSGYCECVYCRAEHECGICKGEGEVGICPACNGDAYFAPDERNGMINGIVYCRNNLARVLDHLDDAEQCTLYQGAALHIARSVLLIKGNGWLIVISEADNQEERGEDLLEQEQVLSYLNSSC